MNEEATAIEITNTYMACAIVEGFWDTPTTKELEIKAWAYLIKTGEVWQLQGWYGRNAARLIEVGWICKDGTINWDDIELED